MVSNHHTHSWSEALAATSWWKRILMQGWLALFGWILGDYKNARWTEIENCEQCGSDEDGN